MRALLLRAEQSEPENTAARLSQSVLSCSGHLPQHEDDGVVTCTWHKEEWKAVLRERQRIRTWRFHPPATDVGDPDRHPWEGEVGSLTVGEHGAAEGCFVAAAIQTGWAAEWMAVTSDQSQLARKNCLGCKSVLNSAVEEDPVGRPWVHLMLGSACCHAYNKGGIDRAWGDDRSYAAIRFMHEVAVTQPFVAMSEHVDAMLSLYGGALWRTITCTLEAVGYEVQAVPA
jgi:hypothetical protein